MTMTYDLTNRQRGYARYLMRLNETRRASMLCNMKGDMANKMRVFIRDEQAKDIQQWHNDIAALYLKMLRAKNPAEYAELLKRLPDNKKQEYNLQ